VHTPSMPEVDVREFAPRAFGAICDILGGEERVKLPLTWRDSFIINFNVGEGEPGNNRPARSRILRVPDSGPSLTPVEPAGIFSAA